MGWAAPGIPWAGGRVCGLTPPALKGCCGSDDDKIPGFRLQGHGFGWSWFLPNARFVPEKPHVRSGFREGLPCIRIAFLHS